MFQQACQLQTSVMVVLLPPSPSNATISFAKTNPFAPSIPTALHHPQLPKTSLQKQCSKPIDFDFPLLQNPKLVSSLVGSGLAIALVASTVDGGAAFAAELPSLGSSLQLSEPQNALSLPTWAIHVSSVVEWITAMVLVWQYGERSGYESWKGLSWGMVPLLGGAFCACTWHFFYNSESLEVLVALQAALTVIGNFTMCIAAFRIYKSSQGGSENL